MPSFRSPAIVLRAYEFAEADRTLVLFTREAGKLRALAKGVRRSPSRLAACVGLLSCAELQFHGRPHQELLLVTQGQLDTAFPRLKSDLDALGLAGRMAELIDRLVPDHEPLPGVYDRLRTSLGLLEEGLPALAVGIWFEIGLLDLLGYRPWLESCQGCRAEAETMVYLPEHGGARCPACGGRGELRISQGTRRLLEACREWPGDKVRQLRLHPQVARESWALLDAMVRHQLGRPLKSDVFRRAVRELRQ